MLGTRGRRGNRLLHLEHPVHRAAEERDLVRREGAEACRHDHGALRGARLVRDPLEEARDRVETREGRQVVEVVEQDRGPGILPEKFHDRVHEFEVQRIRSHGPFFVGHRGDPENRGALEPESDGDARGSEARNAQARGRGHDVPERTHRGAPPVLEDQVVQASLEAVPRGPRRTRLGHRLDHEIPVPDDRVRDEDRPHQRIQGAETDSGVVRRKDGPQEFRHRGWNRARDETKEDHAEHPSTRRLANLPPRTDEEHHRSEHPDEEHGREVGVGRRDPGAGTEGVRRHPVDDQPGHRDQGGPGEGRDVDRCEGPRPSDPIRFGRIREGELVQRRGHEGNRDPGHAGPEEQHVRGCAGSKGPLDHLADIPDHERDHDEEDRPVRGAARIQPEDVRPEKRAHEERDDRESGPEVQDECDGRTGGHSDTISKVPCSTRSGK